MYHFCLDWQNWTYSNHHKGVDFVLELLHVATLWKTCVNMHTIRFQHNSAAVYHLSLCL